MHKKRNKKTKFSLFILMVTLIIQVFASAPIKSVFAEGKSALDIIESVEIDKKSDQYYPGSSLKYAVEWSLNDDTTEEVYKKGDFFEIEIPEGLSLLADPIKSGDMLVGTQVDGKIRFTFTENIEGLLNRKGGFNIFFQVDQPEKEEIIDLPVDLVDNYGNTIFKDTIIVNNEKNEVVGDGTEVFTKGAFQHTTGNRMKWYIRVNQYFKIEDQFVKLEDFVGENHKLVPESFKVTKGTEAGIQGSEIQDLSEISFNYDEDLKYFSMNLDLGKGSDRFWYNIEYETEYTGGFVNESSIKLENTAKLIGEDSGLIPMDHNKEGNPTQGDFNMDGWSQGNGIEGNFQLLKVDSLSNEALKGAEFKLKKHSKSNDQTDDWSKTLITNDEGIAQVSGVKSGVYELLEVKAPEGYLLNKEPQLVYIHFENQDDVFTITVKNDANPKKIVGKKVWQDHLGEELDLAYQEDIVIDLLANGKAIRRQILKKGETEFTFENLPSKTVDGQEINYTLREHTSEQFESNILEGETVIITNTLKEVEKPKEVIDFIVEKKWLNKDGENIDPLEDIIVQLYNGEKVVQQKLLSHKEQKVIFEDLPKFDEEGNEITYLVGEISEDKYEVSVDYSDNYALITNTHIEKPPAPEDPTVPEDPIEKVPDKPVSREPEDEEDVKEVSKEPGKSEALPQTGMGRNYSGVLSLVFGLILYRRHRKN